MFCIFLLYSTCSQVQVFVAENTRPMKNIQSWLNIASLINVVLLGVSLCCRVLPTKENSHHIILPWNLAVEVAVNNERRTKKGKAKINEYTCSCAWRRCSSTLRVGSNTLTRHRVGGVYHSSVFPRNPQEPSRRKDEQLCRLRPDYPVSKSVFELRPADSYSGTLTTSPRRCKRAQKEPLNRWK